MDQSALEREPWARDPQELFDEVARLESKERIPAIVAICTKAIQHEADITKWIIGWWKAIKAAINGFGSEADQEALRDAIEHLDEVCRRRIKTKGPSMTKRRNDAIIAIEALPCQRAKQFTEDLKSVHDMWTNKSANFWIRIYYFFTKGKGTICKKIKVLNFVIWNEVANPDKGYKEHQARNLSIRIIFDALAILKNGSQFEELGSLANSHYTFSSSGLLVKGKYDGRPFPIFLDELLEAPSGIADSKKRKAEQPTETESRDVPLIQPHTNAKRRTPAES